MKILAQTLKDGAVRLVEAPAPLLPPGCVRVRTIFSAISPGTEGNKVVTGRMSLLGKARSKPDQVKQVLDMVGQLGLKNTIQKVRDKLEGAQPLGYSLSGEVLEAAPDVEGYAPGDLVACAGGGYANHADEVVVPVNLVARVPAGVPADAAAMTTLAAIALQGVRLAAPTLGEHAVVIGLGPIGLLACQLLKANGCRVFAADIDPVAIERARPFADGAANLGSDPAEAMIGDFSRGHGADLVLICAATAGDEPVRLAGRIARQRGRIVVVGAVGMNLPRNDYYEKELSFSVSCSYGPGRYDPSYEEGGLDYPYGFVRWTEGRNLEAVLDLVAAGRCDPLALVTHRLAFDDAASAYEMIATRSEAYCGILLEYPAQRHRLDGPLVLRPGAAKGSDRIGVGFCGAGSFAQTFLLPPLKGDRRVRFSSISTRTGLSAADVGRRLGFAAAVSDDASVIADPATDAVFVATRHDEHGPLVLQALAAGKHVFVEKPLCLTMDQLRAIAAKSRELADAGRLPIVQTGFNRRFSQAAVHVRKHFGREPGPLAIMYRVSAGRIPRNHWIQDPVQGGGRILGEVCHFIDLMQYLCGADPVSVSAMCVETSNGAATPADTLTVNLRFADGSVGSLGYFAEGPKAMPKEQVEVFGAGRGAVIQNFSGVTLWGGRGKIRHRCAGKGHAEECVAFLDGIRDGIAPIPLTSQLATTLATLRILESLAAGGAALAVAPADLEVRA
ncbi:MAG: bi-domain-containing oxidoreductase [bacterium]|nr:bi-domain-containing oxidoreductase [bacterium]